MFLLGRVGAFGDFQFGCERVGLPLKITRFVLGGGDRFDYDTEALIIASRKGYRIKSVPITTVYTDQVNKIHPVRDAFRFFKLMRRYKAVGSYLIGRTPDVVAHVIKEQTREKSMRRIDPVNDGYDGPPARRL